MAITPSLETQAGSRRHTPGVFGSQAMPDFSDKSNNYNMLCWTRSTRRRPGHAGRCDDATDGPQRPATACHRQPLVAMEVREDLMADASTAPVDSARPLVSEAMVEKQERARGGLSRRWETVKLAGDRKPPRMPTFRAISQPTKQATKRSRFRCTRESSGRSKVIFSPARGRRATVSRSNMN